jgi:hypothetical protein
VTSNFVPICRFVLCAVVTTENNDRHKTAHVAAIKNRRMGEGDDCIGELLLSVWDRRDRSLQPGHLYRTVREALSSKD